MKMTLIKSLRASVVAASAASLSLIAPAFAEEGKMQQKADMPKFSELDKNSDNALNKEELKDFAKKQNMKAEQILSSYDMNDNDQLDKPEFESLTAAPSRVSRVEQQEQRENQQAQAEQENGPDGAKIKVDQKPTQITVNKPAAQVTIDQPKPKVTITTQDPKIQVEQAEPRVSVQQPAPEVSVDQAKPDVEISDAEPNVQVNNAQPQVDVNEQKPEVSIDSQEQQASVQQRSQQQASMQESNNPEGQQTGIYVLPLTELRTAEVVDQQGESIGNVEEVVIKRDASEAGLIISTTDNGGEARHVYRSVDDFSVEGDQLVLNSESGAQALQEPQGFVSQEYMAVPLEEGTLEQILSQEGLSAR